MKEDGGKVDQVGCHKSPPQEKEKNRRNHQGKICHRCTRNIRHQPRN